MPAKFIVFALLFIACSYASPLRKATMYGSTLFAVPIFIEDLDETRAAIDEEPIYLLDDDSKIADENTTNSLNIEKRSIEKTGTDNDLETAAGTNVLRPLFVYRQQVAYRQRVRNAIRRGRRI